jgi:hypothetical protein
MAVACVAFPARTLAAANSTALASPCEDRLGWELLLIGAASALLDTMSDVSSAAVTFASSASISWIRSKLSVRCTTAAVSDQPRKRPPC